MLRRQVLPVLLLSGCSESHISEEVNQAVIELEEPETFQEFIANEFSSFSGHEDLPSYYEYGLSFTNEETVDMEEGDMEMSFSSLLDVGEVEEMMGHSLRGYDDEEYE